MCVCVYYVGCSVSRSPWGLSDVSESTKPCRISAWRNPSRCRYRWSALDTLPGRLACRRPTSDLLHTSTLYNEEIIPTKITNATSAFYRMELTWTQCACRITIRRRFLPISPRQHCFVFRISDVKLYSQIVAGCQAFFGLTAVAYTCGNYMNH